jgi:hypothetical protein
MGFPVAAFAAIAKVAGPTVGLSLLNMIMHNISTRYANKQMQQLTQNAIANTPVTNKVGSWLNQGNVLQGVNKAGNIMPKTFRPLPNVTVPTNVKVAQGISNVTGGIGRAAGGLAPFLLDTLGRGVEGVGNVAGAAAEAAGRTAGAGAEALLNIPSHMSPISDAQRQLYGNTPIDAVGGIMSDVGKAAGVGLTQVGKVGGAVGQAAGSMIGGPIRDAAALLRMQQIMQSVAANPGLRGGAGLVAARALSAARLGAQRS